MIRSAQLQQCSHPAAVSRRHSVCLHASRHNSAPVQPSSRHQQAHPADAAVAAQEAVAQAAGTPISSSSRRQLLLSIPAALLLAYAPTAAAAAAVDAVGFDLEKQLPGAPAPPPDLPKAYQRTMHRLVKALRESIEIEAAGAKEFEVRRKADGAKDLVKEFVGKWRDNETVVGDVTHSEMKDALSELGRFYQAKGPRARLDAATKESVLAHLAAVEGALPEEEKSLLGF